MGDLDNKTLVQQTMYQKTLLKQQQRKAWDLPHETIIKAFELADLSPSATASGGGGNATTFLEKTTKKSVGLKRTDTFVIADVSPEKLETLKATKNLLLGVTLGQFDIKSIKVKLAKF